MALSRFPMWPVQAPAGAKLAGESIGGRFISPTQARAASVPLEPGGPLVSVASRLPQIIGGLQIRANQASEEAAEMVLEDAKERLEGYRPGMPRWTGELYDSGYVFHGDISNDYFVVFDAEHAPYIEFGSVHNQPPKPYLIPAVEANRDEAIALQAAALRGL